MGTTPRSSFIPKQVSSAIPKKVRRTRVFSIIGFVATTLLIASLFAAGGVFLYKDLSLKKLQEQVLELEKQEKQFDEGDIVNVHNFDRRILVAEELINHHISPLRVFDAIEVGTKQSVQYTSFSYTRRPSGNVDVTLAGVTDEFMKVALQSSQYSEDLILKDAVVTEIGLDVNTADIDATDAPAKKNISFKVYSNVESSLIPFQGKRATISEPVKEVVSDTSELTDTDDSSESVEEEPMDNSASQ